MIDCMRVTSSNQLSSKLVNVDDRLLKCHEVSICLILEVSYILHVLLLRCYTGLNLLH